MRLSTCVDLAIGAARNALRKKGEMSVLTEGMEAPDFSVRTHRGEVARLSSQRGRTIILWFYPKADTPG